MKTSNVGLDLIKFFEGKYSSPYLCSAGYVTIGYGHIIKDSKKRALMGDTGLQEAKLLYPSVTDKQIDKWLVEDLKNTESIVNKFIKVKLTQPQFDALVSHTFNCGVSDTLYKLINTMPVDSEALEIWWTSKYITAGGKKLNGLIKRRAVEYELFRTGKLNLK
jgi:lysozyme